MHNSGSFRQLNGQGEVEDVKGSTMGSPVPCLSDTQTFIQLEAELFCEDDGATITSNGRRAASNFVTPQCTLDHAHYWRASLVKRPRFEEEQHGRDWVEVLAGDCLCNSHCMTSKQPYPTSSNAKAVICSELGYPSSWSLIVSDAPKLKGAVALAGCWTSGTHDRNPPHRCLGHPVLHPLLPPTTLLRWLNPLRTMGRFPYALLRETFQDYIFGLCTPRPGSKRPRIAITDYCYHHGDLAVLSHLCSAWRNLVSQPVAYPHKIFFIGTFNRSAPNPFPKRPRIAVDYNYHSSYSVVLGHVCSAWRTPIVQHAPTFWARICPIFKMRVGAACTCTPDGLDVEILELWLQHSQDLLLSMILLDASWIHAWEILSRRKWWWKDRGVCWDAQSLG
ncbi:hypothetical protein BKA70DRAFT_1465053 [Coprinopsis sp. MPI-PUGE-AT-0042]|nr:hypothetical protein BKA70DRAFT_1465053 [Coprinopsis sp. MPI-PUGE-AT-0042]